MTRASREQDIEERRARAIEWFVTGDRHRVARSPHRALRAYWKGLRIYADVPEALVNCATLFLAVRQADDGVRMLEAAREAFPGFYPIESNLILSTLYADAISPEDAARLAFRWGRGAALPESPPRLPHEPRRLRIGYVSPYFRANPEVYFSSPLIRAHNRSKFTVYLYASVDQPDIYTEKFQSICDVYRPIVHLSDLEVSRMIRRDRINILVDLAGHFAGNRCSIFTHRSAPVQVSFPTWPATTGLPSVDYRVGDTTTDPGRAAAQFYSEKIVRLRRCYCCYEPPDSPEVGPLPVEKNGYITFGVFNRPQKLNDGFLRLCADVLQAVPTSRILFHHSYSGNARVSAEYRKPMEQVFADAGVDIARVSFAGRRPTKEHLAVVGQADIALDSFPYNGMTTTCESYWMGVPVVSLAGRAHVSRVGASLAAAVGLSEWVASTPAEYVRIARTKAAKRKALGRLRRELRHRMEQSPLTDAEGYARSIERIYEAMWRNYVESVKGEVAESA